MEKRERDLFINRIIFGATRCKINGETFYLGSPRSFDVFVSHELYEDCFHLAKEDGIYTENEILGLLAKEGLWSYEWDIEIDNLKKELESLKIDVYNNIFNFQECKVSKFRIKQNKDKLLELLSKRHSYDYMTCEGLASLYQNNYLMLCGLRNEDFELLRKKLDDVTGEFINEVKYIFSYSRFNESQIRELARTEPWRTFWAVSNKNNVFDKPLSEWTEEQKSLFIWSKLYDSIKESMEPPPEMVIEDDDALDGWLLVQHNKRKIEQNKQFGESNLIKNQKISKSENLFIMVGDDKDLNGKNIQLVQTLEEAKQLDMIIGDETSRRIKKERFATIDAVGTLKQQHFGDVKRDVEMKMNNLMKERLKNG